MFSRNNIRINLTPSEFTFLFGVKKHNTTFQSYEIIIKFLFFQINFIIARKRPYLSKKKFDNAIAKSLYSTPDHIECTIETPQFHGDVDSYHMKRQTGVFYPSTLLFTHYGFLGHDVQFTSIESFRTSLVKIY